MRTIYAIRDRVANDLAANGPYGLVIFRNDTVAIRYFSDSIAAEKTALAQHPQDYELIKCGTIDDDGEITAPDEPQVIMTGEALLAALETTNHETKRNANAT